MKRATTKSLKRKLDDKFRAMIHARDESQPCISCQSLFGTREAGHFIKRHILSTRWHPWNVNLECWDCNRANSGHLVGYQINLSVRRGPDAAVTLAKLSLISWKPQIEQLQRLILAVDDPADYESEWFAVQREFAPEFGAGDLEGTNQ